MKIKYQRAWREQPGNKLYVRLGRLSIWLPFFPLPRVEWKAKAHA